MRVIRKYEEESITDAKNVTADTFSIASSTHRENLNAIFASKKLENSDYLVNVVTKMTTNNIRYELNTATAIEA